MHFSPPRAAILALALTALLITVGVACSAEPRGGSATTPEDPGPIHVHGLGINPADGSLYVATHTGLYRMARGSDQPRRVDDRRQDTMGFAVVGEDRFLGSGHPDLREDLPALLGLIESDDAGRTWRARSLLGEADLYVMRSADGWITAYDATSGQVLRSRDGGGRWSRAPAPGPLTDLVVGPDDPTWLVGGSEGGVIASTDAGRTWRTTGTEGVLLAWPRATRLIAVAADGAVRASADGGISWVGRGRLPGPPSALTSHGTRLIAALHDGAFVNSVDGGRTWQAGPWR